MSTSRQTKKFVICVSNDGYRASLELRKVYQVIPDRTAGREGMVRVIDESGEDYLYPADMFAPISLPKDARQAFSLAS